MSRHVPRNMRHDAVTGATMRIDLALVGAAPQLRAAYVVEGSTTLHAAGWQAALAQLERLPFRLLVPGHGAPMDRAAFGRWRAAFDGLLVCAAGPEPAATCRDAWAAALGPLLPAADRARADALLDHYLAEHLRAETPRRDRHCRP